MAAMNQALKERQMAIKRPGDWFCEICGDLQFARNTECRKCSKGPRPESHWGPAMDDWTCLMCGDVQFARNKKCRACGAKRPTLAQLNMPYVQPSMGLPPMGSQGGNPGMMGGGMAQQGGGQFNQQGMGSMGMGMNQMPMGQQPQYGMGQGFPPNQMQMGGCGGGCGGCWGIPPNQQQNAFDDDNAH